eukprot:CAMPEP_0201282014 /NCGR_PEP_ID=MMETSP1317-20130820/4637_1 /ASSEMBLY_ACC=CAM_ASM_000770 /TAXON_ID=187299 /ORGANISM="Undescribed Undescribed, Strain Undescribed" /LENGTH=193 /DNA_ID=CAMNT_0047593575 /DNA_START=415 /DNA_END=996 /DNA_ORIENTATION=+
MYASIQNIKTKTDEELKELKSFRVDDLYVGIESGWNEVLRHINKGNTIEEAKIHLLRLNDADISHMALLMFGVAGKDKGLENARLTAKFLNKTKSKLIWAGTLGLFEGTPLYREVEKGLFIPASEMEILLEEKELIGNIQLQGIPFYSVHPTNTIPVSGLLSRDKNKMIDMIDNGIDRFGRYALSKTFKRDSL